jgi:hypothetical protein
MYGLEGGIRKRAVMYLVGCLPYLWRTIKYEEVSGKDYLSPREAREGLSQYVHFYNEERLHQSLDDRTPKEVSCGKEGSMPSNGKGSPCQETSSPRGRCLGNPLHSWYTSKRCTWCPGEKRE